MIFLFRTQTDCAPPSFLTLAFRVSDCQQPDVKEASSSSPSFSSSFSPSAAAASSAAALTIRQFHPHNIYFFFTAGGPHPTPVPFSLYSLEDVIRMHCSASPKDFVPARYASCRESFEHHRVISAMRVELSDHHQQGGEVPSAAVPVATAGPRVTRHRKSAASKRSVAAASSSSSSLSSSASLSSSSSSSSSDDVLALAAAHGIDLDSDEISIRFRLSEQMQSRLGRVQTLRVCVVCDEYSHSLAACISSVSVNVEQTHERSCHLGSFLSVATLSSGILTLVLTVQNLSFCCMCFFSILTLFLFLADGHSRRAVWLSACAIDRLLARVCSADSRSAQGSVADSQASQSLALVHYMNHSFSNEFQ